MLDWKDPDDFRERLRAMNFGGEREIRQARAQEAGLTFVDLDRARSDPGALASMPAELARELRALPVKKDRGTLWLAMDEVDLGALDRIKAATGLRVVPVMCASKELDAALARWDAKG